MAMIKVLKFVNGIPKELNPEVDSIFAKSIKVGGAAGTELTKELLDSLTGSGDASALHNHDTQYYTKSEVDAAIQSSSSSGSDSVAAEQARAEAAEGDLSDRLDVVEADLPTKASQADLDAEAAARVSGDAATLQSSKDYTDAAEQRIMGGIAPETLDTIAEIAAALENEETATGQILQKQGEFETRIGDLETEMPTKASQASLDQEVSDRQAADTTLQTNINTVSNDLASEITNRTQADSDLDARISAIENDGSDAAAIQAEQTRAQGEESRIEGKVDQEISDRQAADTTLQTNINNEAQARQDADTTLTNALNNEIARAEAAEAAESDARQVGDTLLEDAINVEKARIDQEISDRQAAVSAEQTARESADTTLTNNLNSEISRAQAAEATKVNKSGDTMSGDLNMGSNKITNVAAGAAGSTEAVNVAQLEAAVAGVSSGSSAALDQEIADRIAGDNALQSQITAVATNIAWKGSVFAVTSDAALASATVGTALSSLLPFSDDEGTQLSISDFSAGMKILASAGASSKLFEIVDNGGTLELAEPSQALAADQGFIVKHDLIDSPAAQEGRSIYHFDGSELQKLGDFDWSLATGIDISAAFDDSLASGYISVGDSIEAALEKLQKKIKDESSRAQAAEAANAAAISSEESRALAAEGVLQSNINSEQTRAQGEESRIEGKVDQETFDRIAAVNAEQSAREAGDNTLQDNINLANASISQEVSDRQAADATLQSNIDSESSARQSADSVLQTNIDTEAQARQDADSVLSGRLDAIENDTGLQDEINRATQAEADLQTNINTVASDLANEVTRAQAEEALKVALKDYRIAGEAIAERDLLCLKYDAGSNSARVFKASSAAAANADFNNGSWYVIGTAAAAAAVGEQVEVWKAIGHSIPVALGFTFTSADRGKSLYLGTDGKAVLDVPTASGSAIVFLGVVASSVGSFIGPSQLRGVLD